MLHGGSAWYVGGSFERISPYPAPNLISIDTTGAPVPCPLDSGFDGRVALGGAGSTLLAGGAFTSYRGAGSLTRALLVLDAATGSLR